MRERAFAWDVSNLVIGVDTFNWDSRIQVDAIKMSVQVKTMSLENMSHGGTPVFLWSSG